MTKLKDLYIFEWFEDDFLQKVISESKKEKFKSGEIVFKEWDVAKGAYILTKWIVSVIIGWKTINTIFEWDIFWEIRLVTDEPRTASIKAETDIETLFIGRETLHKILKKIPDWDYTKTTILNRIIQNNKRLK